MTLHFCNAVLETSNDVLNVSSETDIFYIFKDSLLQAQEQCTPAKGKSGENSRGPAWMNRAFLD